MELLVKHTRKLGYWEILEGLNPQNYIFYGLKLNEEKKSYDIVYLTSEFLPIGLGASYKFWSVHNKVDDSIVEDNIGSFQSAIIYLNQNGYDIYREFK